MLQLTTSVMRNLNVVRADESSSGEMKMDSSGSQPKLKFILLIILCMYFESLWCDAVGDDCTRCSIGRPSNVEEGTGTAVTGSGTSISTGGCCSAPPPPVVKGSSSSVTTPAYAPQTAPPPPPPTAPPPAPPPPPPTVHPPPNIINGTGHSPESLNNNSQIIDKGRKRAKVIVIVVVVAAVSVVGGMMIVILKRRHAVKVECKLEGDVEKFILQHASVTPKRYKYSEIKKMTKCWSEKLGEGGYGSVYKGMLPVPDGRVVAVKVLNKVDSKGEDFKNEVASISKTSHVNIVTLLGFCYDQNHSRGRALVYEFMPNGSLDKYLNQSKSILIKLDSQKLHKIALGVAKGLQYLHTGCTTRIVHFDIKPHNILLDEDFCPKISDFGLAKPCKKKQSIVSMPETRGTYGYIAPEVYSRSLGGVSHKSDVYSYGMMLFDMVGARKLVVDHGVEALILSGSTDNYFPDKIYKKVISDVFNDHDRHDIKQLPEEEEEEEEIIRNKMLMVAFWCMQAKPSDRPSISKVIEMLEGSLKSIQIPPNPSVFSSTLPTPDHISSSSSE